ncbi:MAG: DJ-1/PfpI family protein [Planctomycetes bacterium]|nr:DJ-1/PfpI family protein [Planctomycetota bacterium]
MPYEMRLAGKTVVLLVAAGVHDHEFWYPYYRFREEGAQVVVAGLAAGTVLGEGRNGRDGLPLEITHTIAQVAGMTMDCLYLPGGIYNPLTLRRDSQTLELVRDAMAKNIIVGAICHGQWILASAGVLRGRRLTCPDDMSADVIHAGGNYVVEPAVRDGNLITAIYYAYLPEHFRLLIPAMLER